MKGNNELPICSVSGGKDSTLVYCLMNEFYGGNFLPIFADTGNEHQVTINYIRNLHIMANGPEVVIVKADFTEKLSKKGIISTGVPFLDLMLWKGRAPSTKAQFCTEWLKLWPIKIYLEQHHTQDNWVMYSGVRQEESERRRLAYPDFFTTNYYYYCEYVLPLLHTKKTEVFAALESYGVPVNPLYALGYGRVGCFPCIHANKSELSLMPDWSWDKLQYWESKVGRSWFPSGILPGKPDGYIPSIEEVRLWCKTVRGGRQFDLFKSVIPADAPSCMSTWGICE